MHSFMARGREQSPVFLQYVIGCGPDVEGGAAADAPVSMGELLGNKGVLIGCALFSLQQFSGINAIVYFSSSVFAQVPPAICAQALPRLCRA